MVMPKLDGFKSPFFFFSNDQNTVIQFVSPSIKDVLGYSPASVIGRCYTDFLDEQHHLNKEIELLQQRRFNGDATHLSICVAIDASGSQRVIKFQTYGELSEDGQVIAHHGLAQDISEAYRIGGEVSQRFKQLSEMEALLSEREKTVLRMVLCGRLNKSIARELSVSQRAIEMARSRIMKKFNAETAAELVGMAAELDTLRKVYFNQFLHAS